MASAEIELQGHIIDSFILPRVWGAIEDAGAHFHVREMRIGQSENETELCAHRGLRRRAQRLLDNLVSELQRLGAASSKSAMPPPRASPSGRAARRLLLDHQSAHPGAHRWALA